MLGARQQPPNADTKNSHSAPSVGFPPSSDSQLWYKPSQTPAWQRSFGFSQSLGGGGTSPGEDQSPPRCCKVPVGIFLTQAFARCYRSDKALEEERQCPLNPVQLDLLSHSVLMPGKNVLTQQLSKQRQDNRARTPRAQPLSPNSPEPGSPQFLPQFPHLHCKRGFMGIRPAPSPGSIAPSAGCSAG